MAPQLPPELPVGQEAANFLRACESIHSLIAREPLTPDDLDLIEYSAIELLSKLRRP